MSPEKQRIAIAEACGWMRVRATDAKEDNITIRDKRFNGFKRKLLRWDHARIYRGWDYRPGFHQIDIDESNAISTEELLRDYDLPEYWGRDGFRPTRILPRYETDLNAIHEAIRSVIHGPDIYELRSNEMLLNDEIEKIAEDGQIPVWRLEAKDYCEALLRFLGKWED